MCCAKAAERGIVWSLCASRLGISVHFWVWYSNFAASEAAAQAGTQTLGTIKYPAAATCPSWQPAKQTCLYANLTQADH